MPYETVIGIETHVQLNTRTKLFCGCLNRFGEEPNTLTCPICIGMPGVLPTVNRIAVEQAIKGAMVLHSRILGNTLSFDRKNYYYPDLPKGYQISQHRSRLARDGFLTLSLGERGEKTVRIHDAHLEEDTGKIIHVREGLGSLVDLNRAGIPLLEIVTYPDISSPEEAFEYLRELRLLLRYAGVSDCNMEEGSMRCEANISLRALATARLGTKVEIKNIGSLRGVLRALEFERDRQARILDGGGGIIQETRGWDDLRGATFPMRTKEEAQDYRYFPEPDLPPLPLEPAWLDAIRKSIPELPREKRRRFVEDYSLSIYDADVLVQDPSLASFFEAVLEFTPNPKAACNWVNVEVRRELGARGCSMKDLPLAPKALGQLIQRVEEGKISTRIAREVFREMVDQGKEPDSIIENRNLAQISDADSLNVLVSEAISANPKAVADIRKGKEKARGALVGYVMKKTKGKANPELVNRLVEEALRKEAP